VPPTTRHLPNAMVLDMIPEQDEAIAVDPLKDAGEDEDAQMNIHTVVFGLGPGGEVQAGYVACSCFVCSLLI
jgi:hypothetical protein